MTGFVLSHKDLEADSKVLAEVVDLSRASRMPQGEHMRNKTLHCTNHHKRTDTHMLSMSDTPYDMGRVAVL